ncbi:MAG: orotidine 5'-phosphate decarboxylase [Armatimonadetes bacterium RBG_16_58_9]|nr:MAG: orotidine 5'-phosphate decarboxylase [Armatimonadetes bacterium RBG_16_58_9]
MTENRIILPLDVDTLDKALALVGLLKDDVGAFKVGLELVNSAGFGVFDAIKEAGAKKIFYDCKFHDIPNTVAGASRAVARMGIWLLNVHCSGGVAMMRAAKEAATEEAGKLNLQPPKVIGVTLLTSIDQRQLNEELGVPGSLVYQVVQMAGLAQEAGLDGVVASPREIEHIRAACGRDFLIVTPGVRPAGSAVGDQKRVMTPEEAIRHGAGYLVIGRPITAAPDPRKAARAIAGGIGNQLQALRRQRGPWCHRELEH